MDFLEKFVITKLIATVAIVLLLWLSRYFIADYIRKARRDWTSQQRLRWINSTRTFVFVLILMSVIFLWGEAIQGFAISVFAIAFAMVFSVKELLMALNGSIVRFRGKFFEIGDRIEIGHIRGDVIDITLLSTTIEEVEKNHSYTGKTITFSNSLFLTLPVTNESFLKKYSVIQLDIPLSIQSPWEDGKQVLVKIAEEEMASYIEQARLYLLQMEKKRGIQLPPIDPNATFSIPEYDQIVLHLRMLAPTHLKEQLRQTVLTRFLVYFYQNNPLEKLPFHKVKLFEKREKYTHAKKTLNDTRYTA
ncbi:MAG: mechanosensitive ion channel family protein [Chlamydiia bacterium]|nr:mechanosensitive ion channel family protein [Chlamydiia bacterium]